MKQRCLSFSEFVNESDKSSDYQYMFFTTEDGIGFGMGHMYEPNLDLIRINVIDEDANLIQIDRNKVLHQFDELAKEIGDTAYRLSRSFEHFTIVKGTRTADARMINRTQIALGLNIDPTETVKNKKLVVRSNVPENGLFFFDDIYENKKVKDKTWFKVLKQEIQREKGIWISDNNRAEIYEFSIKSLFPTSFKLKGFEFEELIRSRNLNCVSCALLNMGDRKRYDTLFKVMSEDEVKFIHMEMEKLARSLGATLVTITDPMPKNIILSVTDIFNIADSLNINVRDFEKDFSGDIAMHTIL